MGENKLRMKRDKIITLLRLVTENGLKIEIAADEICDLFDVSKCVCKCICEQPKTYYCKIQHIDVCELCHKEYIC